MMTVCFSMLGGKRLDDAETSLVDAIGQGVNFACKEVVGNNG